MVRHLTSFPSPQGEGCNSRQEIRGVLMGLFSILVYRRNALNLGTKAESEHFPLLEERVRVR
jgi:hypothetical protein